VYGRQIDFIESLRERAYTSPNELVATGQEVLKLLDFLTDAVTDRDSFAIACRDINLKYQRLSEKLAS
jgi:hypothetical protein